MERIGFLIKFLFVSVLLISFQGPEDAAEPISGGIAKSRDPGYIYGTFSIILKSTREEQVGTYVSIWAKQSNGKWKFVLDTGNQGL